MSKDYDVVLDTLQNHYNKLWKMTQQNMESGCFNIMDQIRLEQCRELELCIAMWKNYKKENPNE